MAGVQLNLGCGLHAPESWTNIDRSFSLTLDHIPLAKALLARAGLLAEAHMVKWPPNVRSYDVTKGLPYDDGSVDTIYSSHMLEHLYLNDARSVLTECHRVLRRGGIVRLALPDGDRWAAGLVGNETEEGFDNAGAMFNYRIASHPDSAPTLRMHVANLVGSAPHRWQPSRTLMSALFAEAGFSSSRDCRFLDSGIADVAEVEFRADSLFIEAVR